MGILYLVATPIGNLEDITLRALRVLKEVEYILCEDTRVSKKLLDHYQINTPVYPFHQHSGEIQLGKIASLLSQGKSLALITDAGTPGVSDPGGVLVAAAIKAGHKVVPIPGASALTAALSIAGIPMEKFLFLGFLPHKKGRQTLLKQIAEIEYPVVLCESVHRIEKLLQELVGHDYHLIIGRELTKQFETIYRGTVEEIKKQLIKEQIKGEFVLIIQKVK